MRDSLDIREGRQEPVVPLEQCSNLLRTALQTSTLTTDSLGVLLTSLSWHARNLGDDAFGGLLDLLSAAGPSDPKLFGVADLLRGQIAFGRNDYQEALSFALNGRTTSLQHGTEFVASCCCRLAANAQYRLGHYDASRLLLEECVVAARRSHDDRLQALALADLALVDKNQGALGDAEARLGQALAMFERLQMPLDAARCELNLGNVHFRLGRWDKSLHLVQRSLVTFERLGHDAFADTARIAYGRGLRFAGQGELAKAVLTAARARAVVSGNRRHATLVLEFLGDYLFESGNSPRLSQHMKVL